MAEGSTAHQVRLGEDDGRAALLVDGVVQSISPEDGLVNGGYWAAMVPPQRPSRARENLVSDSDCRILF